LSRSKSVGTSWNNRSETVGKDIMHCSRMLRLCAIPTALLLFTGVARGQVPATPDTAFGLPGNEPLDLSTPLPDESKHKTVNPFASMPPASDWSSKAGIDYRKPSFPAADPQPGALTAGSFPDQSNGVAWATVTAPGFQFPLGWDQTSIETRVDPSQQQSKVGTTLSRSVHGRKVAALAERGAEAVRRTFQRNRLGERDSDRRDLEKPHRRLQAPVVISALGRPAAFVRLHALGIGSDRHHDPGRRYLRVRTARGPSSCGVFASIPRQRLLGTSRKQHRA